MRREGGLKLGEKKRLAGSQLAAGQDPIPHRGGPGGVGEPEQEGWPTYYGRPTSRVPPPPPGGGEAPPALGKDQVTADVVCELHAIWARHLRADT